MNKILIDINKRIQQSDSIVLDSQICCNYANYLNILNNLNYYIFTNNYIIKKLSQYLNAETFSFNFYAKNNEMIVVSNFITENNSIIYQQESQIHNYDKSIIDRNIIRDIHKVYNILDDKAVNGFNINYGEFVQNRIIEPEHLKERFERIFSKINNNYRYYVDKDTSNKLYILAKTKFKKSKDVIEITNFFNIRIYKRMLYDLEGQLKTGILEKEFQKGIMNPIHKVPKTIYKNRKQFNNLCKNFINSRIYIDENNYIWFPAKHKYYNSNITGYYYS